MSRKKIYLLLPVFALLVFSFGGVSFAQDVDNKALEAESKETLTTEAKEKPVETIIRVAQAEAQEVTKEAKEKPKTKPKAKKAVAISGGAPTKEMQEMAMNYYNIIYPSEAARALWDDNVGMEKGMGAWQDIYKPIPLQMYWFPRRHYIRPEGEYYDQLLNKYEPGDCVECHEHVTPGWVHDWRSSTHANPKKNSYFAKKTREIEQLLGREINEVLCSECHGKDHSELRMPTPDICGKCHPKEVIEYMEDQKYGRPNHIDSNIANFIVPWYAENARQGYLASMFGCDYCHSTTDKCDSCHTRHKFAAAEARRPEACMSCHMGFDHPDAESYRESKMGIIYHLEGEHWDWDKPLEQVVPGKDYRAPTCQFCHMYQGEGKFTHTTASKGIWRMGTIPPKGIDYKSSLKDYPYGVNLPPLNAKIDIYTPENKKKREKWIEMCSNCHSPRFARIYLENMDQLMFEMWRLTDRAHLIMDGIAAADAFDPPVSERGIYPMGDVIADALGPKLLGEGIYNAFKTTGGKLPVYGPILGVYGVFMAGENNPSVIENLYSEMWFGDKAFAYKGTAHVQQDLSWWYGAAKAFQKVSAMESEARKLLRAKGVIK